MLRGDSFLIIYYNVKITKYKSIGSSFIEIYENN